MADNTRITVDPRNEMRVITLSHILPNRMQTKLVDDRLIVTVGCGFVEVRKSVFVAMYLLANEQLHVC